MYQVSLTESLFPAQTDEPIWQTTVGDKLREVAARDSCAPALVEVTIEGETARRWTYGELLAESEELALALASRFAPGERVAVWANNLPEWIFVEYACGLAGLVLVTVNPAFQQKELRYVLEQSGAVALFRVESYRANPMAAIGAEAVEGLEAVREVVDLRDRTALHRMGERAQGLPEVKPGDPAQIQYTSGTTGFPKGAVLSHRGLINNARFYVDRCGTTGDTTWANMMPLFHTSGCGMLTLGCLQAGCRMVLFSVFDPDVVNRVIEQERINIMLGVPTMILALVETFRREPRNFSCVRLVSSGGAVVAPELVRSTTRAFGCSFSIVYGQTEYSPTITQHHGTDSFDDTCNTVGQPIEQTAVSIRRMEDNDIVPVGEVGEICTRGACTMICYHGNPDATAQAIDADGWLHTGDLGSMDSRGYVRVTGRVKDMIIRGGENYFPVEIENVLLEHPAIAEIAVVGLPDDQWGEIIAAFYRTEGNAEVDLEELRAHCRAHLAPQKTPQVWQRVTSFPLTGSGKIRKFALRDRHLAGARGSAWNSSGSA